MSERDLIQEAADFLVEAHPTRRELGGAPIELGRTFKPRTFFDEPFPPGRVYYDDPETGKRRWRYRGMGDVEAPEELGAVARRRAASDEEDRKEREEEERARRKAAAVAADLQAKAKKGGHKQRTKRDPLAHLSDRDRAEYAHLNATPSKPAIPWNEGIPFLASMTGAYSRMDQAQAVEVHKKVKEVLSGLVLGNPKVAASVEAGTFHNAHLLQMVTDLFSEWETLASMWPQIKAGEVKVPGIQGQPKLSQVLASHLRNELKTLANQQTYPRYEPPSGDLAGEMAAAEDADESDVEGSEDEGWTSSSLASMTDEEYEEYEAEREVADDPDVILIKPKHFAAGDLATITEALTAAFIDDSPDKRRAASNALEAFEDIFQRVIEDPEHVEATRDLDAVELELISREVSAKALTYAVEFLKAQLASPDGVEWRDDAAGASGDPLGFTRWVRANVATEHNIGSFLASAMSDDDNHHAIFKADPAPTLGESRRPKYRHFPWLAEASPVTGVEPAVRFQGRELPQGAEVYDVDDPALASALQEWDELTAARDELESRMERLRTRVDGQWTSLPEINDRIREIADQIEPALLELDAEAVRVDDLLLSIKKGTRLSAKWKSIAKAMEVGVRAELEDEIARLRSQGYAARADALTVALTKVNAAFADAVGVAARALKTANALLPQERARDVEYAKLIKPRVESVGINEQGFGSWFVRMFRGIGRALGNLWRRVRGVKSAVDELEMVVKEEAA